MRSQFQSFAYGVSMTQACANFAVHGTVGLPAFRGTGDQSCWLGVNTVIIIFFLGELWLTCGNS